MQTLNTVHRFLQAVQQYPDTLPNLIDSVSDGQLKSKEWLVSEVRNLNLDLGTIFLCAGWYGTLAHMLFESKIKLTKIRSFDVDESCYKIAERINKPLVTDNWKFKASTLNVHDLNYDNFSYKTYRNDGSELLLTDTADTIVNTSCEHITNFDAWYNKIPAGKLLILQTNNLTEIEDHINCSLSLSGFGLITPMSSVLYEGQNKLDKYIRFMRIGYK